MIGFEQIETSEEHKKCKKLILNHLKYTEKYIKRLMYLENWEQATSQNL